MHRPVQRLNNDYFTAMWGKEMDTNTINMWMSENVLVFLAYVVLWRLRIHISLLLCGELKMFNKQHYVPLSRLREATQKARANCVPVFCYFLYISTTNNEHFTILQMNNDQ